MAVQIRSTDYSDADNWTVQVVEKDFTWSEFSSKAIRRNLAIASVNIERIRLRGGEEVFHRHYWTTKAVQREKEQEHRRETARQLPIVILAYGVIGALVFLGWRQLERLFGG